MMYIISTSLKILNKIIYLNMYLKIYDFRMEAKQNGTINSDHDKVQNC